MGNNMIVYDIMRHTEQYIMKSWACNGNGDTIVI